MLKIADSKFLECPLSAIPPAAWDLLGLVTDATDREGNILHLPCPGALLDQPPWFRQAVRIVRAERGSRWLAELIKDQSEKGRNK